MAALVCFCCFVYLAQHALQPLSDELLADDAEKLGLWHLQRKPIGNMQRAMKGAMLSYIH